MKKWSEEIEINAPIEQVWQLIDGPIEEMQKIMPNLIENEPITITDEMIGSVHRQSFKVGKRFQTFDIKTLQYKNNPEEKHITLSFIHGGLFEIITSYDVKEINEAKTHFRYTTATKPLKWYLRFFMLLGSGKVAKQFVKHVKRVAEREVN